jgi:hypothetical protein
MDVIKANLDVFKEFVELLEDKYPNPTVTPSNSLEWVMYTSGQRSVVSHIRDLVERAEEEVEDNILDDRYYV